MHRLTVSIRSLLAAMALLVPGLPVQAAAERAGSVVLAVGEASIGGAPTKGGAAVQVGDRIVTGANGYVYVKTVDNGFLILRPQSAARIVAYHVDAQNPADSRFKFELEQGVARSISGTAVKHARQNFRFNTPVAAIGVRGTDFTVSTDQQVTRIQVVSGGIAASGFGDGCTPDGSGPCEGPTVRELFATQGGQMLLINRQQPTPEFLRGNGLAPDAVTPPRPDEPAAKSGGNADAGALRDPNLLPLKLSRLELRGERPETAPEGPPALLWGRWKSLAGLPATVNRDEPGYRLAALNTYYAVMRDRDAGWQAPAGGTASFSLRGAEAHVQVGSSPVPQAAGIENASLAIDFNRGSFTTRFDLLTQDQRLALQAAGGVGSDGSFSNPSQSFGNTMVVQGVLANAGQSGLDAAYLFRARLDDQRIAYGATAWAK